MSGVLAKIFQPFILLVSCYIDIYFQLLYILHWHWGNISTVFSFCLMVSNIEIHIKALVCLFMCIILKFFYLPSNVRDRTAEVCIVFCECWCGAKYACIYVKKNLLMFACLQWQHCKMILNGLKPHGVGIHFDSMCCWCKTIK